MDNYAYIHYAAARSAEMKGETDMSITVADCLKLPAMREARLAAGGAGLNRFVTAVSVIEYPNISLFSSDLVVGNEMMISALVYIKDDVEQQCQLIRHLHSMGSACLVLYYVGIFVQELDRRLVETADSLGFPLVAMPAGRMDYRYSDLIAEVMEWIIADRKQEKYYVSEMVNRISQLAPQHQTMSSALRLLSDRLHCTFLLADRYLKPKAAAAWPISNQWDYPAVLNAVEESRPNASEATEEYLCGKKVFIWDMPVRSKRNQDFHLFVMDETGTQKQEELLQAAEVIELFLNIWNQDHNFEGTDALVHAILSDQPAEKERLAAQMHIDIEPIHTIWILRIINKSGVTVDGNQRLFCLKQLKQYLQDRHKLVIVDTYSHYVVALSDDSLFDDTELSMAHEFARELEKDGLQVEGVICQGVENTAHARSAYLLSDANLDTVRCIYPERRIFTLGEVQFAQNCRDVLEQGEDRLNKELRCFDKIYALPDRDSLLQTLCVYLLDANTNTQETGQFMYLHKNTVKYRLNKIRAALNYDITQMPETYALYQAAALYRLLKR